MKAVRLPFLALLAGAILGAALCIVPAQAADIDFAALAQKTGTSAPVGGDVSPELVAEDQAGHARYVHWQRDYARRGWEWHLFSTQLLFSIVMGIVAFGLWITYLQFRRDYTGRRARAKAGAPKSEGDPAPAPPPPHNDERTSTLKIGPAGLELTSQVVGLLVLAMSLAFFYFYVKEVYPMREIAREAISPPPALAPPSK